MSEKFYVLATAQPWNLAEFARARTRLDGSWVVVTTPADLDAILARQTPRYIFFPHWSHIVDPETFNRIECVCFHMTDLPYGRGGSPLQNLIERGHGETILSALRMTEVLDGGPIYAKRPLSLEGSAEAIFVRSAALISEMIESIAREEPAPDPQVGEPTLFRRRKPEQSALPQGASLARLYDHVRMLDAPGYPKAFLEWDDWRLEFDSARMEQDRMEARVRFSRGNGGKQ